MKGCKHNGQLKKRQRDKQRSTKHTHKAKDRVTRPQLKTDIELRCSGRVSGSCSTSSIICGVMVIVFVSGKLKYLKPDICCLQMSFLITIIIIESKMNILWYMYMPFSDTFPDTSILYYRNDEPMWCHSLSKWWYMYKAVRCELSMRLHYRIFRQKLSRYNITCLVENSKFASNADKNSLMIPKR